MQLKTFSIDNQEQIPNTQGLYAFYLDLTDPLKLGLIGNGPFEEEQLLKAKKLLIRKVTSFLKILRGCKLEGMVKELDRGEHLSTTYNVQLEEVYAGNLLHSLKSIPANALLEYSKLTKQLTLFSQPIYVGITKKQTLHARYHQHKSDFENSENLSHFGVRLRKSGFDWDDLIFSCLEYKIKNKNLFLLNILEKQLQTISNPSLSIR